MQLRQGDWRDLFRECRSEAFHLEVRDDYAVAVESEPFRRFLDNEPDDYAWFRDWEILVEELTGRGVTMRRVRVVTVPHTDYQRWSLIVAKRNIDAGEDIRYLPRHLAGEVPPDDWWLMDDERVIFNLVDQQLKSAGIAITTDPRIIEYCQGVKQRLWSLATPHADYAGGSASQTAK
ncbi:DUF6879 family protein [Nocardia terpenica]|uniref:DUF6879 domain-containing protein n=1 Tax=Nocardia terpenica TaxID=455432 RepID=A0A6G9Z6J8_9NOCA|nr:DUF6879 family protein [Nocardia terpenica]QIS21021.1 hypothetical protein F6W96_24590 [Nocardia terpenica]